MSHAFATQMTFVRRRALVALVAALAMIALLATATSAHQTLIRSHVAADGTVMVSGFDGGVALAPAKP
jgi:methionine-rich copper-binding protein CopC